MPYLQSVTQGTPPSSANRDNFTDFSRGDGFSLMLLTQSHRRGRRECREKEQASAFSASSAVEKGKRRKKAPVWALVCGGFYFLDRPLGGWSGLMPMYTCVPASVAKMASGVRLPMIL